MEEQNEACDKATGMKVDNSGLGDEDDVSSEVSVNSKGFPMILKTPEASKEGSGLAAAAVASNRPVTTHCLERQKITQNTDGKRFETRPLITQISWGKGLETRPFTRFGQAAIPQQESPVSQSSLGAASCRSSREASHQEPTNKRKESQSGQEEACHWQKACQKTSSCHGRAEA